MIRNSRFSLIAGMALMFALVGGSGAYAEAPADAAVAKTTLENLQAAFNGESNANAKYLAFAVKADEEGYGPVASLFRAAARAEQVHFERHAAVIKSLGGMPEAKMETPIVKSTAENLQDAINGETYETTVMYPSFLVQAKKENIEDAIDAFEDAGNAEAVHAKLYTAALANLETQKGGKKDLYVCPKCGNVEEVLTGMSCVICKASLDKFITVS